MLLREPLPSTDFTKRLEFAGTLACDGEPSTQFSIEIVYSTINGHPTVGLIRGTANDYDALRRLLAKRRRSASFSIVSSSTDRPEICCSDVVFGSIGQKWFTNDDRSTVLQIIGRFTVGELSIRSRYSDKAGGKRRLTYILEGPRKLWLSNAMRELSYTGSIHSRRSNTAFSLRGAPKDRLTVGPTFFYADSYRDRKDNNKTIQHESFSITVADNGKFERDADAFLSDAKNIAETLCLLMGFLSKARIEWFSSIYTDESVVVETFKNRPIWKGEELHWEEVILKSEDIRRFLNKAFSEYSAKTLIKFDLRLPILHYIAAQSSRYVEDRFALLFFALEKMLSSLDGLYGEEILLT